MKSQKIILAQLLLLICITLNATGASWIESRINPIMTNDEGYVLCKTKYEVNMMGGGTYTVDYGFCVITDKKILEYTIYSASTDTIDDFDKFNEWRNWFNNISNNIQENKKGDELIDKYNFKNTDLSSYLKNDTISISTFNKENKINICKSKKVQSLRNGKPDCKDLELENTLISFDFKYFILTKNIIDLDWNQIGINFNYRNKCLPLYFEVQNIDAVIFK